jgi:hypothetical protein
VEPIDVQEACPSCQPAAARRGPVFAADTAAPSSDTSASAPAKSTHKSKHHTTKKHSKAKSTDSSGAPK